jgi:hypothetical protein
MVGLFYFFLIVSSLSLTFYKFHLYCAITWSGDQVKLATPILKRSGSNPNFVHLRLAKCFMLVMAFAVTAHKFHMGNSSANAS